MSPMLGSLQCLRHKYRRYDSDPFLRVGFCSGHMLYWRSQSFFLEVKKKIGINYLCLKLTVASRRSCFEVRFRF